MDCWTVEDGNLEEGIKDIVVHHIMGVVVTVGRDGMIFIDQKNPPKIKEKGIFKRKRFIYKAGFRREQSGGLEKVLLTAPSRKEGPGAIVKIISDDVIWLHADSDVEDLLRGKDEKHEAVIALRPGGAVGFKKGMDEMVIVGTKGRPAVETNYDFKMKRLRGGF